MHDLLLFLRQSQAYYVDPPAADAARDQHDGIKHKLRAYLRRMVEMNVEIVSQRQLGLLFSGGYAVDLGQFAERVLARHHEIAEQMRIGCRTRRHVDKEAVERLRL